MMVIINVGDDYYFSTVLKIHFDSEIDRFLGHRAKPLQCTVYRNRIVHKASFLFVQRYNLHPISFYLALCVYQRLEIGGEG
jgi:hypothetical protein